jgi:ribosome-binding factor A
MKGGTGPKRSTRVGDRVREEVATFLGRSLSDPRLTGVVVTRAEISDDLSIARVLVRVTGEADAAQKKRVLAGLSAASGRIRRHVADAVGLRRAPEIKFHWDDGIDASDRVGELLAEIERERRGK